MTVLCFPICEQMHRYMMNVLLSIIEPDSAHACIGVHAQYIHTRENETQFLFSNGMTQMEGDL